MNSETSGVNPFFEASVRFASGVHALRTFCDRIGKVADAHDLVAVNSFAQSFSSVLSDALNSTFLSADPIAPDLGLIATIEHVNALKPTSEQAKELAAALAQKDRIGTLVQIAMSLFNSPPTQGDILRQQTLVSLMSHFEALVSELLHLFYSTFPDALPDENRQISLRDLRTLQSVSAAETFCISKEVDSVLREPLSAQLDYLGKRPKLDLGALHPYIPLLCEIDQRRNLYVHNRGRVNRYYLANVDGALTKEYEAKEGCELRTGEPYMERALTSVLIAGCVLLQLAWRKWSKTTVDVADHVLQLWVFNELEGKRYQAAKGIAQIGMDLRDISDENRRVIIIHYALACREQGDPAELDRVLATLDWSACSLRFKVALHALRQEDEQVAALLPRAIAAAEVDKETVWDWPIINRLRTSERFKTCFG